MEDIFTDNTNRKKQLEHLTQFSIVEITFDEDEKYTIHD